MLKFAVMDEEVNIYLINKGNVTFSLKNGLLESKSSL